MHASAGAVEASSPGGQRLAFWGALSLFLLAGATLYAFGLHMAGLVTAGMQSLASKKRINTPYMDVRYTAPPESTYWHS